jgi:hypothetical protein
VSQAKGLHRRENLRAYIVPVEKKSNFVDTFLGETPNTKFYQN